MKNWMIKIGIFVGAFMMVGAILFQTPLVYADDVKNGGPDDIMAISEAAGQPFSDFYRPKGSIVIDSDNGQILWSDNADDILPIASLSKLMSAYIVLEEAQKGTFSLEQTVTVSKEIEKIAQIYALSNNKMIEGVEYTVNELLTLMLIPSSNAATVMLSDFIYPNDRGAFVDRMNETAKKLGMENTSYYNASGASAESFEGLYIPNGYDLKGDNVSTARDISILIYHLMNKHPEILNYTKNPKVIVKAGTPYEESFESYVLALEGGKYGFTGMDGLKTGSSPSAAFGYGATAERNGYRLIEVLLGVGTWEEENGEDIRFPIGNALLDKLFNEYEKKKVLSKGEQTINDRELVLEKDLYGLLKPEQEFTFEILEEGIRLNNGLDSVSENISSEAVPFVVKDTGMLSFANNDFTKELGTKLRENKLLPLLMGFVGLVIIMLNRLLMKRHIRHNKKNHQLKIWGILFGVLMVIGAILLTLEQLLSHLFV